MFRLPKSSSNQSPLKRVVGTTHKNQGLCKYSHRKCSLLCLENYDYCIKHILEDKSSPYKPCQFLYTVSGKKCGKPAYRPERKETWFCGLHTRRANLLRQKASSRHAPPQTQEALLASLAHYARSDQAAASKEGHDTEEAGDKPSSQAVNPFVEVDAAQVNAKVSQVLDCASDSDSDVEAAMLDSVWRAQDNESSDAESVDSQAEDPMKHAGVYTAEEVTVVIKDKMIRLQSLYIDQFRRLQHVLKERRRKYLHALKKEKDTLCSIHDQEKTTAKEQKLYQKLKALNHIHKYYGEEAVLHKKSLDRRAQVTEGSLVRTSHKGKCAFTEGGVKCGAKTLPVTKYCRKHILEDTQQVLFRACGFTRDDHTCQEPTLNVFENATCVYHVTLPSQPHNTLETVTDVSCVESEIKDTLKTELVADENIEDKATNLNIKMVSETPELPTEEDVLKPIEQVDIEQFEPCGKIEAIEESPADVKQEPLEQVITADPIHSATVDVKPPETAEVTKQTAEEKMEFEITSPVKEEILTQESPADDLVMVDMMTDVGVVEEVLETDGKTETDDNVELTAENVLGNG